jgi:hypothetical protein
VAFAARAILFVNHKQGKMYAHKNVHSIGRHFNDRGGLLCEQHQFAGG